MECCNECCDAGGVKVMDVVKRRSERDRPQNPFARVVGVMIGSSVLASPFTALSYNLSYKT